MPAEPAEIDVIAFETSDGTWIAQGVQHDIVARAKSATALRDAFRRQISANMELNKKFGRNGLEGIPPAPEKFKRLFDEAKERMSPTVAPPESYLAPGENIRITEAA
jgi:hypothetical protein